MKISCDIINDLLPLYAEQMASPDSVDLVESHLRGCLLCQAKAQSLKQPIDVEYGDDADLSKLQKQLQKRRSLTAWFVFLLTASVLFAAFAYLSGPVYLSADDAVLSVVQTQGSGSFLYYFSVDGTAEVLDELVADDVQVGSDGLIVILNGQVGDISEERHSDPDTGETIVTLSASSTRWDNLIFNESDSTRYHIISGDVSRVYYAGMDGQDDVLLWGDEPNGGVQTLPRLVLRYYLLLAVIFGIVLLAAGWLVRVSRIKNICLAAGCYLFCFAVSNVLISGVTLPAGEDVPVLLCFMLLLAALVTAAIFCGRKVWQLHQQDKIR